MVTSATSTPCRAAVHSRCGRWPSVAECWTAAAPSRPNTDEGAAAMASVGKVSGAGIPPAREMRPGSSVTASRSRMADEPTRRAAADSSVSRSTVSAMGPLCKGWTMSDSANSGQVAQEDVLQSVVAELDTLVAARGPLFRRLARSVAAGVDRGALARGTRLPAERRLAAALGVSRGTVVAAYDDLV